MKKNIITIVLFFSCLAYACSQTCQFSFINREWEGLKSPIVKLNINGKIKCFMIDSGSSVSIIEPNVAKTDSVFPDHYLYNVSINSISGEDTQGTQVYKLRIEGKPVVFYERDLHPINRIYEDWGIKIYGILGADFLIQRKAVIDYNKRQLIINQ